MSDESSDLDSIETNDNIESWHTIFWTWLSKQNRFIQGIALVSIIIMSSLVMMMIGGIIQAPTIEGFDLSGNLGIGYGVITNRTEVGFKIPILGIITNKYTLRCQFDMDIIYENVRYKRNMKHSGVCTPRYWPNNKYYTVNLDLDKNYEIHSILKIMEFGPSDDVIMAYISARELPLTVNITLDQLDSVPPSIRKLILNWSQFK